MNSYKEGTMIKTYIEKVFVKGGENMNEMETNRSEYVGGGYRDYRGGYRMRNNRDDYRDEENYRNYDMRGGKMNNRNYRNYRNYREEDEMYDEIEEAMYDAKECHRKFEDLAEMTDDEKMKNTLMKIAMREKEHYTSLKELLEK